MTACSSCGEQNPSANRFCGHCGSPLPLTCPACGTLNPPGSRFCGHCGNQLAEVSAPALPLLTERRLVTVLFADLAGYTPFSEQNDPEDVRALLTRYFERSREVIERFGGTVDKYIGDAVMAVWGAVIAHEDDGERAVRAGLELVDAVAKLGADAGAPDLAVRVGVHTGEASVGPGGNQMGLVAGDNVNIASRLQSIAEPGAVLVGESTYQAASRAVTFEPVGERMMKGKSVPLAAWRALQVVAERGGRGRAETLEPPFVGRVDEFRLLKDLLASVGRDSRSRMVSLVGEAGIGKSRLVWELLRYIDGLVESVYWHEGRSPAYGDGVTFYAVAEMIRSRAGIADTDSENTARLRLNETLDTYLSEPADRAWVGPRLAAVLGIGEAPAGDRSELDAAVRAFFSAVSEKGTTVLVFEDLHWADTGLLDFVEELTDWWRDRPILIVTMARPDLSEKRPSWGAGRHGLISLNLGPLPDVDMERLVNGTVPGLPQEAVKTITARAAGVPLYAVEMLRMLLVHGDVEEVDGNYRLVGDLSGLAVPESLQAVIGARLDRLEPAERTLVQDAAVLGQSFTLEGLAVLTGQQPVEVESRLERLARRELIEPVRDSRSPERGQYRFLQGLIRDVALGRMSREVRRARHLQVARYFEELVDPELAVVVASHYLEALRATPAGSEAEDVRAKAIASMWGAVNRAADLRAHQQVISISEQALTLADSLDQQAPFWERMAEASTRLARREDADRFGRLALDYYRSVDDEPGTNRLTRVMAFGYLEALQPDRAQKLLEPHLRSRDDLDSDAELARAAALHARALMLLGNFQEAILAAERALAAAEKLELMPTIVDALITLATALGAAERRVEARILLEGAVELADRHDLTHASMRGRNNLAYTFGATDPGFGYRVTEEAFGIAKRMGDRSMALFLANNLSGAMIVRAQWEAIEQLLAEPILADAPPTYQGFFLETKSQVAGFRGDLELADRLHQEALRLVADETDPQTLAAIDGSRAGVEVRRGNTAEGLEVALHSIEWSVAGLFSTVAPATMAVVLSGQKDQAARLLAGLERYPQLMARNRRYLAALMELDSGEQRHLDAVAELVATADAEGEVLWSIMYRVGAGAFLPRDDPKRLRFVDEARQICDDHDCGGIRQLIDRFLL